ncbi:MAG: hypothetical protein WED04_03895 [Promethearchaeati archaeon SRVP18_Atabeyarchaeia-1]
MKTNSHAKSPTGAYSKETDRTRQPSRTHQKVQRTTTRKPRNIPATSNESESSKIELATAESIRKAGDRGVLQIHLLKKLGVDNRKGIKLISKLEEQGLVRKSRELYGGKWTYRLTSPSIKPAMVSWGDLDCPCFFCNDAGRCGLGNVVSPSSCSFLSGWLKAFLEPATDLGESGGQAQVS